jgi:hypothetical protein
LPPKAIQFSKYLENLFAHTSALPFIPKFSQPAAMHRDAAEHNRHVQRNIETAGSRQEAA